MTEPSKRRQWFEGQIPDWHPDREREQRIAQAGADLCRELEELLLSIKRSKRQSVDLKAREQLGACQERIKAILDRTPEEEPA